MKIQDQLLQLTVYLSKGDIPFEWVVENAHDGSIQHLWDESRSAAGMLRVIAATGDARQLVRAAGACAAVVVRGAYDPEDVLAKGLAMIRRIDGGEDVHESAVRAVIAESHAALGYHMGDLRNIVGASLSFWVNEPSRWTLRADTIGRLVEGTNLIAKAVGALRTAVPIVPTLDVLLRHAGR